MKKKYQKPTLLEVPNLGGLSYKKLATLSNKEFEAYFLEQMFKEMLDTIPKNEDMSASTSTLMDYYTDEMMQKLATDTTETSSLGLAQTLYEQMKRNYDL
jgi:flagellar protein FlgJ